MTPPMTPTRSALLALSTAALLSPTLLAQSPTPLVQEGDMINDAMGNPIGLVTRIDDVDINSQGEWIVELDTDAATSVDTVILDTGVVAFQEGTGTGLPLGYTLGSSGDRMHITDGGDRVHLLSCDTMTATRVDLLLWNGLILLEEDVSPFNGMGAPAGAIWESVSEFWANNSNQILVGGRLTGSLDVLALITHDGLGNITAEQIVAIDGTQITGHATPIQGFSLSRRRQAINDSGTHLWFVDDDHQTPPGNICCDSWINRDNLPLLHEGDPTPLVPANVIGSLSSCEIDLNNGGDWVVQMGQNPSTFNMDIILKNGTQIIAEEGQTLPSIPSGFLLDGIGSTSGVIITDGGDVIWHATWDDPSGTTMDAGIFVNQELFIREGVSTVGGLIIQSLNAGDKAYEVSPNGQFMIAEHTLSDGTNGAYLYDLVRNIGTSYCSPAVANSSGSAATLQVVGSTVVTDNDVTLTASDMPTNAFGFFLTSMTQGLVMNPGGSQGNLCLAGSVGRYVGPGQIAGSGMTGSISLVLDLGAHPTPGGLSQVIAGETWNFQAWFRDSVGSLQTSNFTDAVSVPFN